MCRMNLVVWVLGLALVLASGLGVEAAPPIEPGPPIGPGRALGTEDTPRYVDPAGSDVGNDCSSPANPCATIQHAIDSASAGDTVHVAAGTYAESLNIEAFSGLTISGADKDSVILQPASTHCFDVGGYGCARRAAVRVVNSTGVALQHLTMDFALVTANNIIGVLYWDATGAWDDNVLKNMSLPDTTAYYEITSYIRAPSYTDAARAGVSITGNTFSDTGRVGIVSHEYVSLAISGNTFGKNVDDFGYALEIGSASEASISNNVFYGYDTPAASDGSESGAIYIENSFTAGITGVTKNVSISGNEIYGCQWGVLVGNEWDGLAGDVDIVLSLTDNNVHDNLAGAVKVADEDREYGSSVTVTASGNTLTDNGDYGYYIYTQGDGDITANLTDETITGHGVGIYVEETGTGPGSSYAIAVDHSILGGNTLYGLNNTMAAPMVDAEYNYWGSVLPAQVAAEVAGSADFQPWCNEDFTICDFAMPVHNITQLKDYATIQAAVDEANDGDVIEVDAGAYPEAVTIDVAVTLLGAQAGNPVAGRTAGSAGESIIDARGMAKAVTILHSNVVLDGFDILGDAATYAGVHVYATTGGGSLTTIAIRNNFVHGMALPNPSSGYYVTSYGIWSLGDRVGGINNTITDLDIEGNKVYALGGAVHGADVSAGAGVWLYSLAGGGGGGGALITGNVFDDIRAGYDAANGDVEPGVGVLAMEDGYAPFDAGARAANNQYSNLFAGVTMGLGAGEIVEQAGQFANVTVLVGNYGNLAAVDEVTLARYAKTDMPTGVPGPSTAYWARIQDAVDNSDAGATVTVSAGTFEEQVHIIRPLTLVGAGAGSTTIEAPDALSTCFVAAGSNRKPIVCVTAGAAVTVQNLTVDGAGKGNANASFIGIAYYNAAGTISGVTIAHVRDTPFSGTQHGVGIYVRNDDAVARTFNVQGCDIHDFQKNGTAFLGANLTVNVAGTSVTGAGPTSTNGQNGIQISDGAGGTITDCTISGIAYVGPTWMASGILLSKGTTVDIGGATTIVNSQVSILYQETNGTVTGVAITSADVDNAEGISIRDYGQALGVRGGMAPLPASPYDSAPAGRRVDGAATSVTVDGVTLIGTRATRDDDYGITAWGLGDAVNASVTNSHLHEWSIALLGYEYPGAVTLSAHDNCLEENDWGFYAYTAAVQDATANWWGDAGGPYHATTNPGGLGSAVTDNVDFEPWIVDGCGGVELGANWQNTTTGVVDDLQGSLDNALPGETIVPIGASPLAGGGIANQPGVTVDLSGRTVGPGSAAFVINAADVTIKNGVLDGDTGSGNSTDPAIVVQAGADNFTLADVEIRHWADGVELAGNVTSFKMGENWIHLNTDAGMQIDSAVTSIGGVVTIEGNLFKANGGSGIRNDSAVVLDAEYNSWGDLDGPTVGSGDGVSGLVDYEPWTFIEFFFDVLPDSEALVRYVPENTSFDVALKADAEKVYALAFQFTYDPAYLTLNSTTFAAPWSSGFCFPQVGLPLGTVGYVCTLLNPTPEWDVDGGTIATLNFTSFTGPVGEEGPWPTYLDISHLDAATAAAAVGGIKVWVNNAGYDAPSIADRDITDTDDGQVIIVGETTVTLDPTPAAIDGCAEVEVAVWVNNVIGLYGADVELTFDPAVLEVVDFDPATPGVQLEIVYDFFNPGFVLFNTADNTAGTIHYLGVQLNPTPPADGSGALVIIHLRAKAASSASPLHFTRTDLSTRDGLWIVNTPVDGEVTTVPPAGLPVLSISRLDSTTARLNWTAVAGAWGYHLYRDTTPYFVAGTPYQSTAALQYDDVGALGDVNVQHYYQVSVACENGFSGTPTNRVGEYDYVLANAAAANYSDIAIVFDDSAFVDAASLATYIGPSAQRIMRYNPATQSFQTFIRGIPGTNFPLTVGQFVFVVTNNTAPVSVALVGGVPDPGAVTFSLVSGSPAKYNYISLPLDQGALTSAAAVATNVGGGVLRVMRYRAETQTYQTYIVPISGTNFPLVIGEPFILVLTTGAPPSWPY